MKTTALLKAKIEGTTFLGGGRLKQLRERDQLWVLPLAVVGIAAAAGTFVWLLVLNYTGLYQLGRAVGQPALPLYVAVLATWVLTFVAAVPLAISVLYFSRDARILVPLPLPAWKIVTANLGLLYLYSLPLVLVLYVPAVVVVAAAEGVSVTLILGAALTTGTVTLVPLAISVVIVTLIARVVQLSRYRTALEALGMVLLVVVLVGVQLLLSRTVATGGPEQLLQGRIAELILSVQGAVPPAAWAAGGLFRGGLGGLLLFVILSLVLIAGVDVFASAAFLRQVAVQSVTRTRRRRGGRASVDLSPRSAVRALADREYAILTSNSTFIFETAGEVLIFPLILGIMAIATPGEVTQELLPFVTNSPYIFPILLGLLVLLSTINTVSSTALSREGASFDLSLSLPLPGSLQARGKMRSYLQLFYPALVLNATIATALIRLPWTTAVLLSLCAIPFLVLTVSANTFADLRRPLLSWSHPQQAMKQNMNVFVGMGLSLLGIAVGILPGIGVILLGASQTVGVLAAVLVVSAVAVFAARAVLAYADRRYERGFVAE
jgi:ABC-2 type transport system permease protein